VTEARILSGVALLQRGGEDLVAVAGGTTGTGPDTECTLGTRFQIASVSKQFTAAAVLLLCDRGILSAAERAGGTFLLQQSGIRATGSRH
jgi:CubicO group peptidase (beta-lactamase class C family)